ncbi:MAG: hypothetical protein OEX07_12325, partial [Gammaproteobacteria bacterium]|nr:hypothetical protein [Gammaproteobacteria bacterium]
VTSINSSMGNRSNSDKQSINFTAGEVRKSFPLTNETELKIVAKAAVDTKSVEGHRKTQLTSNPAPSGNSENKSEVSANAVAVSSNSSITTSTATSNSENQGKDNNSLASEAVRAVPKLKSEIKKTVKQEEIAKKEKNTDKAEETTNKNSDSSIDKAVSVASLTAPEIKKTGIAVSAGSESANRSKSADIKSTKQPASGETMSAENLFLERLQLDRVINNFKYTYENGDIEEFSTLFVDTAVTNDGFSREQIVEDYELLFDDSDKRSIDFKNIKWKVEKGIATGFGMFKALVQSDGEVIENKEGKFSIKVISAEQTKKITELFFLHQFAEVE